MSGWNSFSKLNLRAPFACEKYTSNNKCLKTPFLTKLNTLNKKSSWVPTSLHVVGKYDGDSLLKTIN